MSCETAEMRMQLDFRKLPDPLPIPLRIKRSIQPGLFLAVEKSKRRKRNERRLLPASSLPGRQLHSRLAFIRKIISLDLQQQIPAVPTSPNIERIPTLQLPQLLPSGFRTEIDETNPARLPRNFQIGKSSRLVFTQNMKNLSRPEKLRRLLHARRHAFKTTGQTDIKWLIILQMREIPAPDRKSTRLNSSHVAISYAVFCFNK